MRHREQKLARSRTSVRILLGREAQAFNCSPLSYVAQSDLAYDTMFKILHGEGFFGDAGGNVVGNRAMYTTYGTMYNQLKVFEVNQGDRQKRQRKH